MWSAHYKSFDLNGLDATIKVTVTFVNDSDGSEIDDVNFVLPENVDSDNFRAQIQTKVDTLNKKFDFIIGTNTKLVDVTISMAGLPNPTL